MPYITKSSNPFYQKVLDEGIKIYQPDSTELTLDMDCKGALVVFSNALTALNRRSDFDFRTKSITQSSSPGRYHIIVVAYEHQGSDAVAIAFSDTERVAYQLILGSSKDREANAMRNIMSDGCDRFFLFQGLTRDGKKWTALRESKAGRKGA
jgi:hypothetical protein